MVKKIWWFIASAFLLVLGLFGLERSRRKEAESKLSVSEHNNKIIALKEQINSLDKEKQAVIKIAEVEKGRTLSIEEMEDFLKKL